MLLFICEYFHVFFQCCSYVQNYLESVLPLGQYTPPLDIPVLAKLMKVDRILRGKLQELQ